MGIIKQAKNMKVVAGQNYQVSAGKLSEVANKVNIESQKENLQLFSSKKIDLQGNDGVKYAKYSPPELIIEESEYKLESRFAMEQLFEFAKKDSKAMFCFWMADIFGGDIPLEAYEQLYKDASDKKESILPEITVARSLPGKGAVYNADTRSKFHKNIIISEGFINEALEKNDTQKLLMIALVEEFGHHLDYLLRFEYSAVKGDAPGDEGAKYTSRLNRRYQRYLINPFANKEQEYAKATIKGEEKKLVWDFSDLNQQLTQYVDNRTEKDDNFYAGYEFFGAGLGDGLHGWGHQKIEEDALGKIPAFAGDKNTKRLQVYFGNWMRDFSQFVDPMVIRPMANALDMMSEEYKATHVNQQETNSLMDDIKSLMDINRVTLYDEDYKKTYGKNKLVKKTYQLPTSFELNLLNFEAQIKWEATSFSPVKLSREGVTTLVELIAVKEFGELSSMEGTGKKPPNYMKYLDDFRAKFTKVTPEKLGVYRPEEHIDNPAALHRTLICKENEKKGKACPEPDLNYKLDPDFVKDPLEKQWDNSDAFGTKNYIRGNDSDPFPSAYSCFIKFIDKSNLGTVEGRMNFGAALHILEDYYAHSNFCELAVMKVADPKVFPWDNLPDSCKSEHVHEHRADIQSNRHAQDSVVKNRNKIKFRTLNNPALHTAAVANYLKHYPNKTPAHYYYDLGHKDYWENKGLYYSHAECAPVLTGSFGPLDTIASIAPKINSKYFSIKIEEQKSLKEGERTFNDALIYELLKDVTKAQGSDTKEGNANYKGSDDNIYSETFLQYLNFRDFIISTGLQKVFDLFGILDFVTNYIKVIQNTFYHFLSLSAINLIDDYQTYLENELTAIEQGNWKVNAYGPSHTQLAKDNGLQPLHGLAVDLAKKSVERVGRLFVAGDMAGIKNLASTELFVHPMYADWMDEYVIAWSKQHPYKLKLAHEASVVLWGIKHGLDEVRELINEIHIISQFNTTEEQQQQFKSAYANIPGKWRELRDRTKKLWEDRELDKETNQAIPELSNKDGLDDLKREKGHVDGPKQFGQPIPHKH